MAVSYLAYEAIRWDGIGAWDEGLWTSSTTGVVEEWVAFPPGGLSVTATPTNNYGTTESSVKGEYQTKVKAYPMSLSREYATDDTGSTGDATYGRFYIYASVTRSSVFKENSTAGLVEYEDDGFGNTAGFSSANSTVASNSGYESDAGQATYSGTGPKSYTYTHTIPSFSRSNTGTLSDGAPFTNPDSCITTTVTQVDTRLALTVQKQSATSSYTHTFETTGVVVAPKQDTNTIYELQPDEVLFELKQTLNTGVFYDWSQMWESKAGTVTVKYPNPGVAISQEYKTSTVSQASGSFDVNLGLPPTVTTESDNGFFTQQITIIPVETWDYNSDSSLVSTTTTGAQILTTQISGSWQSDIFATVSGTSSYLKYSLITCTSGLVSYSTTSTDTSAGQTETSTAIPLGAVSKTYESVTTDVGTYSVTYQNTVTKSADYSVTRYNRQTEVKNRVAQWGIYGGDLSVLTPAAPIGFVGFGDGAATSAPIHFTISTQSSGSTWDTSNLLTLDFPSLGNSTALQGGRIFDTKCGSLGEQDGTTAWSVPDITAESSTETTVLATYSSTVPTTTAEGQPTTSTRSDKFASYTLICSAPITGDFYRLETSIASLTKYDSVNDPFGYLQAPRNMVSGIIGNDHAFSSRDQSFIMREGLYKLTTYRGNASIGSASFRVEKDVSSSVIANGDFIAFQYSPNYFVTNGGWTLQQQIMITKNSYSTEYAADKNIGGGDF